MAPRKSSRAAPKAKATTSNRPEKRVSFAAEAQVAGGEGDEGANRLKRKASSDVLDGEEERAAKTAKTGVPADDGEVGMSDVAAESELEPEPEPRSESGVDIEMEMDVPLDIDFEVKDVSTRAIVPFTPRASRSGTPAAGDTVMERNALMPIRPISPTTATTTGAATAPPTPTTIHLPAADMRALEYNATQFGSSSLDQYVMGELIARNLRQNVLTAFTGADFKVRPDLDWALKTRQWFVEDGGEGCEGEDDEEPLPLPQVEVWDGGEL